MRNIWYSIKNLRWAALLPLVVLFLVFPLLVWSEVKLNSYSQENLDQIGDFAQMLLPFSAIFGPVFIFRQYVEGGAREVIFFYRKGHLLELCTYGGLYLALAGILFLVLSGFYQDVWWEYLRIAVQSVFFLALSYASLFVMRSTALGLMASLMTESFFVLLKDELPSSHSLFSFDCLAKGDVFFAAKGEVLDKYLLLLLLSALLLAIGYWRAQKWRG